MINIIYQALITLFFIFIGTNAGAGEPNNIYSVRTDKSLQDVLDDTEFAITERNLRITGRLHIGKAIRERGRSEFPDYEIIMYCSLDFAEKMLELSPEIINSCPGRITIIQKKEYIIITAPLWSEHPDNQKLNILINRMNKYAHEIVDFAAEDWLFEK